MAIGIGSVRARFTSITALWPPPAGARLRRRQRLGAHRGRSREQGGGAGGAGEQRAAAERQHRQSCHVRAFLKWSLTVGIGR